MTKPDFATAVERVLASDQLDKLEVTGSSPVTPIPGSSPESADTTSHAGWVSSAHREHAANGSQTASDPREAQLTWLWGKHRLEFLMLGEGSTASVDQHGGEADSRPPKDAGQELRELEGRWEGCHTNDDRREVILDAQETLRDFKFPKADPTTIRDTLEWKEQIAKDPRPIAMVAQFWGVGERTVSKYRQMFKEGK